jgi:hypothetical protein
MKLQIAILHDYLNPNQEVPFEVDDFSVATPYVNGSAIMRKSSDVPVLVHETPREVITILQAVADEE